MANVKGNVLISIVAVTVIAILFVLRFCMITM